MSFLKLPVPSGNTVKILQITDTHLFKNKDETLLGINTYNSYHAVLAAIKAQAFEYDLIVATGDLVQDHSSEAYQYFVDGIKTLSSPCVWLPGNHDFQPAMVNILTEPDMLSSKEIMLGDNWYLILLDSQVFGTPHGELSDYQLEWLAHALETHNDKHFLVLLHHPPMDSGCIWLDQHRLRNSHELHAILKLHPNAKTILCGHIHQELDLEWNQCRVLTTPSTCIQFKPHCTNFTLDSLSPGWRHLVLKNDGTVETTIHRLETSEFLPNMDSNGY